MSNATHNDLDTQLAAIRQNIADVTGLSVTVTQNPRGGDATLDVRTPTGLCLIHIRCCIPWGNSEWVIGSVTDGIDVIAASEWAAG